VRIRFQLLAVDELPPGITEPALNTIVLLRLRYKLSAFRHCETNRRTRCKPFRLLYSGNHWQAEKTMKSILVGALMFGLVACAGGVQKVGVYHSLNARQCEQGGLSLAELKQSLSAAGVQTADVGKVTDDGRMRVTVCGAPDGKVGVFQIDKSDLARARQVGFELWPARQ
jgi:hypothetical protein